jgi:hypothetical protein
VREAGRALAQTIHETLKVETMVSLKAELATPLQQGVFRDG